MDISEQLNVRINRRRVEPFLEVTPELVQKRRSQGRIIFDRFIRNRTAIVGAVFLILLFLFFVLGRYSGGSIPIDRCNRCICASAPLLATPTLEPMTWDGIIGSCAGWRQGLALWAYLDVDGYHLWRRYWILCGLLWWDH